MSADLKTIEPFNVIGIRHVGAYNQIGSKFGELFGLIGQHGIPFTGSLGLFHDDPATTPEAELQSDACAIVPADYALPESIGGGVSLFQIPGGLYAVATHLGPYEGLGKAWEELIGDVSDVLGKSFAEGPSFEIYVNDCAKVAPEQVQTDLYVPVR